MGAMRIEDSLRRAGLLVMSLALAFAPVAYGQNAGGEDVGPPGLPDIEAVEGTHDFGTIWSGHRIEHVFEIKNTGSGLLKITKVKPSCGCTVAKQYDREIAPGAIGKIPISIDSTRLQSRITKTITVSSNDTDEPSLRLTVTGTVNPRVKVEPKNGGTFGRVKPNEQLKRTLTLRNNTETPVELSLKSAAFGAFKAELKEVEAGQVFEMTVETVPSAYNEQYNRGQFELATNIAEQPKISVPVNVFVLPAVEVTPADVIIPKPQPTVRNQPVAVTFNTEETHKILSANVNADNVKVNVKERRPNSYTVTLELPPNYVPPSTGHKLTIKTDYEKKKEVVVNIAPRRIPNAKKRQAPRRPAMALLGKPVPAADFTTPDDQVISTSERGKPTFYMFYASWCGYCKKALPSLNKLSNELGESVRFVAVSQDTLVEDGNDPAVNKRAKTKQYVVDQWKGFDVSFPMAFDPSKSGSRQFKVSGFPTMFLANKDGSVERVYVGIGALNDGSMKKDMETLAKGGKLPKQEVAAAPARPKRPALQLEGKNAPPATFTTTDGQSFASVEEGKATVAMFYASWCGFCKKTLPILQAMYNEMKDQPVRFVAVSMDTLVEDGNDPSTNRRAKTKDFVINQFKDLGVEFTQAFDSQKAGSSLYKVQSFPTMFLIDGKGKINKVYVGGGAAMNGSMKKDIEAVLKNSDRADAGSGSDAKLAANRK